MVETFVPQEYCSGCWYIPKEYCYDNLVHDTHNALSWPIPNGDWNPGGGDVALARDHYYNHSEKVPSDVTAFKEEDVAIPTTNMNDTHYWDKPDRWEGMRPLQNKITDPIYHIKYDGVDHYFKDIERSNYS